MAKENNIPEEPLTSMAGSILTINYAFKAKVLAFRAFDDKNQYVHLVTTRTGLRKFENKIEIDVPSMLNLNGLKFDVRDVETKSISLQGTISYGK